MQRRSHFSRMISLYALACAGAAALLLWPSGRDIRTEDQNHDGRPDVWRMYDRQGRLSNVALDTNFDGRPDVREYYEDGALVRRESDRDFNDRVDLVQDFDPTTRELARSIIDVDFDGTADLLVLFRGGQPVFSKWAQSTIPAVVRAAADVHAEAPPSTADGHLAPLEDPFSSDLSLRAVRDAAGSSDGIGLSTSGGLPTPLADVVGPLASSSGTSDSIASNLLSATVLLYAPRGPPAAPLPS
jgi:hypothetical protein